MEDALPPVAARAPVAGAVRCCRLVALRRGWQMKVDRDAASLSRTML